MSSATNWDSYAQAMNCPLSAMNCPAMNFLAIKGRVTVSIRCFWNSVKSEVGGTHWSFQLPGTKNKWTESSFQNRSIKIMELNTWTNQIKAWHSINSQKIQESLCNRSEER